MNENWIKNRFQGLTREQLRQAGVEMQLNFGPNTGEDVMRKKLCEKLGVVGEEAVQAAAPAAEEAAPVKMRRMLRPRLAPGDVWEGRRHKVRIHRNEETKNHKSCVLGWEFVKRSFAYEEMIDMPEPYFFVLRDAKIGRIEQEPELDKMGFRIGTINKEIFVPRFSYDYYGVTEATKDLPGSIIEYWQRESKANDYFRKLVRTTGQFGRHRLIQIHVDLMGTVRAGHFRDYTNEDIWQAVMQFLGFEDIFYEDEEPAAAVA